jgi:hypothetical protein
MEATIVLQGFYSQKLVTGAFANRGIQSATFVAPAGTTAAVCYAWIARPAAGSNIQVDLYDVTGGAIVASALYNTAGWDTELAKDGTTTFKQVVVSSAAGIIAGRTYRLRIFNTVDTGATYYVDKCFWKWGTATAPDEWCSHPIIHNHYDTTEGAAHVNHINYFDVADLKGTDESRLLVKVANYSQADQARGGDLIMSRRSSFTWPGYLTANPANARDTHWLEAEDGSVSNWAAAALARCSGGSRISNAANTSGSVYWIFRVLPAVAWRQYADQIRGRWDVFGMVYTDDPTNTQ